MASRQLPASHKRGTVGISQGLSGDTRTAMPSPPGGDAALGLPRSTTRALPRPSHVQLLQNVEHWQAQAFCDVVSRENHGPAALIFAGSRRPSSDFQAEPFVKPPVTLDFVFPHPVDIDAVFINPNVGSHTSSTIDIYTSRTSGHGRQFSGKGRVRLLCPDRRHRIVARGRQPLCNGIMAAEARFLCGRQFAHGFLPYPCGVRVLRIRIVRTLNSTVPALGELQVLGRPSSPMSGESATRVWEALVTGERAPADAMGSGLFGSSPFEQESDLLRSGGSEDPRGSPKSGDTGPRGSPGYLSKRSSRTPGHCGSGTKRR